MNTQNGGQQQNPNHNKNNLSWSTPQKPLTPVAPAPTHHKPEAPLGKPIMPAESVDSGMSSAKIVGWLAGGIVAGVVLAWGGTALLSNKTDTAATETTQTTNSTTSTNTANTGTGTPAEGSDPSLLLMSPQKAGTSVAINKAIVSEPTWVVVYESRAGKPGNVLGAALFFPDRQAGTVELLRGTVAGQTYFVTKHQDNGDRKFSLAADAVLTEGGEAMWVTFTAN